MDIAHSTCSHLVLYFVLYIVAHSKCTVPEMCLVRVPCGRASRKKQAGKHVGKRGQLCLGYGEVTCHFERARIIEG